MTVRVVLLDIEGTTTPVDFVHRVLFPYAHARVESYLAAHAHEGEVLEDIAGLRELHSADTRGHEAPPPWDDGPAPYARWLMDRDRKATPLKSLQGKIWADGYAKGELLGPIYDDVPRAFRRWTEAGKKLAIFSSGSVQAQKLIFAHSTQGDLTPFLSAYFDTRTGAKGEAASYRTIAKALAQGPADVLFVSDALTELDAAASAGLKTAHAVRSDIPRSSAHEAVTTFDALP